MRTTYQTTNGKGLDRNCLPMRLWHKAKKFGIWNPSDIDFSQDVIDFKTLTEVETEFLLLAISQFQAGEEAVTLDLLPLIMAIAKEGRLEEELFLTSFLWEEAKHVDGFNRWISEVTPFGGKEIESNHVPSYQFILNEVLPQTLGALVSDPSPVNQVKASTTYNMIVEGVLAETGYYGLYKIVDSHKIFPGLKTFIGKLKQDESRHIAYGIYLISRLVSENGDEVWDAFQEHMNMLLVPSMKLVEETYGKHDVIPFGVDLNDLMNYAMGQFQKRLKRIEKARNQSLAEINADLEEV